MLNNFLKISFCTVCMNRLYHLKNTLPKNIIDNINYPNLEFILLDYNSQDDLETWVKIEMNQYIERGILKYYKTFDPQFFIQSHSKNLAFKLAGGEIFCNVDADNFTGQNFADYINTKFKNDQNIFLKTDHSGKYYNIKDALGRICLSSKDFFEIRGYDESMKTYGFDDYDICNRLGLLGRKEVVIEDLAFLNAISHSDEERIKNESLINNLDSFYINYKTHFLSEILFLFSDQKYYIGNIINNENTKTFSIENALNPKAHEYQFSIVGDEWQIGKWERNNRILCLIDHNDNSTALHIYGDNIIRYLDDNPKDVFYRVTEKKMINEMLFLHSQVSNRMIMKSNLENGKIRVNNLGFGKGKIFKNFNYSQAIILS